MRPRRLLAPVLAVAALASCSGAADQGDHAAAPGASSGSASATTAVGGPCAWALRADKATLNIAYPDTAATYWGITYTLAPDESLELDGRFPDARYASFITYGATGGALDTVSDKDLRTDGTPNPFTAGAANADDPTRSRFTLEIVGAPADGEREPGTIRALPSSDAPPRPTATATASPGATIPPPANVLGTGGAAGVRGTILYRVYVPADASDPAGVAGLPDVTVIGPDGERRPVPTCANPGASPSAGAVVEANGPATDRPAPAVPIFIRPAAGQANLFPNPDNVYVATIVEHRPGRVVVVRGKAPTFPDPRAGRAIGSGEQVRYFSFCTNEYRKPYPVSFCATDAETVLDDEGWFTYVVSTPEDRPARATAANGVTWLDWGATDVNGLLLFRHMLADPGFAESAVALAPGALAASTMGDYAPKGAYCTTAEFDAAAPACSPT